MKNSTHRTIDIGQVAVPVFTCLLGAVLITVLAAPSAQPIPAIDPAVLLRARLEQARASLAATSAFQKEIDARLELTEIKGDHDGLDKKLDELEKAKAVLTNQVSHSDLLQSRLDEARRNAETTESESRAARLRLAEVGTETRRRQDEPIRRPFRRIPRRRCRSRL